MAAIMVFAVLAGISPHTENMDQAREVWEMARAFTMEDPDVAIVDGSIGISWEMEFSWENPVATETLMASFVAAGVEMDRAGWNDAACMVGFQNAVSDSTKLSFWMTAERAIELSRIVDLGIYSPGEIGAWILANVYSSEY